MNLGHNILITHLMGATTGTAANTTETPGHVDMAGWNSCFFLCISGDSGFTSITDMFIEAANSTAGGATGFISLEAGGAVVASPADYSTDRAMMAIDVNKPNERYLACGFTSGETGDVELVVAIQYDPLVGPVEQSTADTVYDLFPSGRLVVVASPTSA